MKLKRWLVSEAETILAQRPDVTMVAVADGAPDNWTFLSGLSPDVEVLDFYHACTHLQAAADHAVNSSLWSQKWRTILLEDVAGVERVIAAIRGLANRASTKEAQSELRVVLKSFRTHRHWMSYADFKQRGLPIGSGIVEAANKTHIGERLKKSGMRWSVQGGQEILSFRSLLKSGRFDQVWNDVMVECDTRKPVNDNWAEMAIDTMVA